MKFGELIEAFHVGQIVLVDADLRHRPDLEPIDGKRVELIGHQKKVKDVLCYDVRLGPSESKIWWVPIGQLQTPPRLPPIDHSKVRAGTWNSKTGRVDYDQ